MKRSSNINGPDDDINRLISADRSTLWHPFTQMRDWAATEPLIIDEARGCYLRDVRGRWYLDGVSSLWVNIHGHRRPELDDAIREQLTRVAHTTMLGLGNVPAIRLGKRLIGIMEHSFGPERLTRVFYSDNGSTAVEVALKMAFQYWQHKGQPGRTAFMALDQAYHGDTVGAMSVGGIDTFHAAFGPLLFKAHRAPSPSCYHCNNKEGCSDEKLNCLAAAEEILKAHSHEIAAVIIEPLVQAAGGMLVARPGYLAGLRARCDRYGVLLIADEVATGFGRTGRMFACEHEGVAPDIICLSKGLTGGYMPLAATIASEEIYSAFLGEFAELKTFFHGHSYTGNPLGCACALAAMDVFDRDRTIEAMQPKVALLEAWLKEVAAHPHVGDARNRGLMAGVELVRDTGEPYRWEERMGWRVADIAREQGVLIRPLGNVVVIMPPLVITEAELGRMLGVLGDAIKSATA